MDDLFDDEMSNMCRYILSYIPECDDAELLFIQASATLEVGVRSMGRNKSTAQEPEPAHE